MESVTDRRHVTGRPVTARRAAATREQDERRFRRLYEASYEPVLAYALRRCGDLSEAHDIASDTFLVLWRRLADAPADEEVPLWLYGVARRVVANRHRTAVRRERLVERLGSAARETPGTDELATQRENAIAVLASLRRLGGDDREILLLAAWERLSAAEIALVLGCSPNAAAIRLHRARKRLAAALEKEHGATGHRKKEPPQPRQPSKRRR